MGIHLQLKRLSTSGNAGWQDLERYEYRWMLALALGLPVLQQVCGVNTVILYSSTVSVHEVELNAQAPCSTHISHTSESFFFEDGAFIAAHPACQVGSGFQQVCGVNTVILCRAFTTCLPFWWCVAQRCLPASCEVTCLPCPALPIPCAVW